MEPAGGHHHPLVAGMHLPPADAATGSADPTASGTGMAEHQSGQPGPPSPGQAPPALPIPPPKLHTAAPHSAPEGHPASTVSGAASGVVDSDDGPAGPGFGGVAATGSGVAASGSGVPMPLATGTIASSSRSTAMDFVENYTQEFLLEVSFLEDVATGRCPARQQSRGHVMEMAVASAKV